MINTANSSLCSACRGVACGSCNSQEHCTYHEEGSSHHCNVCGEVESGDGNTRVENLSRFRREKHTIVD